MELISDAKQAFSGKHGIGALYLTGIVFILHDIIPTPMDAWYFSYERKLRTQFESKEITPKQYWRRKALAYYGSDATWYSFILLSTLLIKGNVKKKLLIAMGLIGTGAVFSVIHSNINKDVAEQKINA